MQLISHLQLPVPCHTTCSQVLGVRWWASLRGHYSAALSALTLASLLTGPLCLSTQRHPACRSCSALPRHARGLMRDGQGPTCSTRPPKSWRLYGATAPQPGSMRPGTQSVPGKCSVSEHVVGGQPHGWKTRALALALRLSFPICQ